MSGVIFYNQGMWEQYCIVTANKYMTALIKAKGNWIQMDTIKTSNSHNLSSNDLKDVVYLGLDFIFWKIWKIITFHAHLKSGGCCLFYCAVHLKWLFYSSIIDFMTHILTKVLKSGTQSKSCQTVQCRLKWPAYSQIFSSPDIFGEEAARVWARCKTLYVTV